MSRADISVKHWWNLPISNPKPDLLNINACTKFGKIPWYSHKLSSRKENIGVSQADNSFNFDEIYPLAIPNQISTILMHIPCLVKIHWCLLKLSYQNKIRTEGHSYDWQMDRQDGQTTGHPTWNCNTPPLSCGRVKNLALIQFTHITVIFFLTQSQTWDKTHDLFFLFLDSQLFAIKSNITSSYMWLLYFIIWQNKG